MCVLCTPQCAPPGCLIELCIQLSMIMLGKQLIQNNVFEILIPYVSFFIFLNSPTWYLRSDSVLLSWFLQEVEKDVQNNTRRKGKEKSSRG